MREQSTVNIRETAMLRARGRKRGVIRHLYFPRISGRNYSTNVSFLVESTLQTETRT